MLKFFRKHARGWFKIFIFMIIAVFVLYFGSTRGGDHTNVIAKIDKKVITQNDLFNEHEKLMDMARLSLKDKLTPDVLKKMDLKAKAYNNILNREIILAKASDLKIQVSDNELKSSIISIPALQTNGVFDERKYQQLLRFNRMSADDFENSQRADLTARKIESFVREGVKISDKEIYDLYALQNRKVNINFLKISKTDIKNKISPIESELEDFLKRNGNLFRIPEQLKIKYILFSADAFSSGISDEDVRNYYSGNQDKFKTKDNKPIPLNKVQGDIIKELKRIRGMQTAYAEARKAREEIYQNDNMDDYGTKHNLTIRLSDFFTINKPPQEFAAIKNVADVFLDMQKGDLSKILSDENGYYLIQVIDKQPAYVPKLQAIEQDVKQRFMENETLRLAEKEAQSILKRLQSGESFEKIAAEKGLKLNETGFFQPGNNIPNVGQSPDATEMLMQLSAGKPYTEKPLLINDTYFILKFKDTTHPDDTTFEAQKGMYQKILTAMKQDEAMQTWLEGNKTAMIKEKRLKIKKKVEDL